MCDIKLKHFPRIKWALIIVSVIGIILTIGPLIALAIDKSATNIVISTVSSMVLFTFPVPIVILGKLTYWMNALLNAIKPFRQHRLISEIETLSHAVYDALKDVESSWPTTVAFRMSQYGGAPQYAGVYRAMRRLNVFVVKNDELWMEYDRIYKEKWSHLNPNDHVMVDMHMSSSRVDAGNDHMINLAQVDGTSSSGSFFETFHLDSWLPLRPGESYAYQAVSLDEALIIAEKGFTFNSMQNGRHCLSLSSNTFEAHNMLANREINKFSALILVRIVSEETEQPRPMKCNLKECYPALIMIYEAGSRGCC